MHWLLLFVVCLIICRNQLKEILRADRMDDATIPGMIQLIQTRLLDISNLTRMRSHIAKVDDMPSVNRVELRKQANKSSLT